MEWEHSEKYCDANFTLVILLLLLLLLPLSISLSLLLYLILNLIITDNQKQCILLRQHKINNFSKLTDITKHYTFRNWLRNEKSYAAGDER